MVITQDGYNSDKKNLGGQGKLLLDTSSTGTCRLEPVSTTCTPDGNSYISLGGFQIGTATFGSKRALWTFTPDMSADDLEETCWEGLKFEIMSDTNYKAFCSYNISYSKEDIAEDNHIVLGGGRISLDTAGRILTVDNGIPEETKEAVIGSKRVTLGRFGNFWSIALYSRFKPCVEDTISPQANYYLNIQNHAEDERKVLTTTFDPQIPCPDGIQIWLERTSITDITQIYFEVSTDGGTTWAYINPQNGNPSGSTVTIFPDKEFGTDILLTVSPVPSYFEGGEFFREWITDNHIFILKNLSDNSTIQIIEVQTDSV